MLFWSLLVLITVLNVADLVLTLRFMKEFGLDLEANPIARWVYRKLGPRALVVFKAFFSVGTVLCIGLVHESYLALPVAVFGALVMVWAVSKNYTMVTILSGLR